nr:hypothetical protein [Gordonia oryzae]
MAWCGICGTDLHEYADGPTLIPMPGLAQPISAESAAITRGHVVPSAVSAIWGRGSAVGDLGSAVGGRRRCRGPRTGRSRRRGALHQRRRRRPRTATTTITSWPI